MNTPTRFAIGIVGCVGLATGGCVAVSHRGARVAAQPDGSADKAAQQAEEAAADSRKLTQLEREAAIAQESLGRARIAEVHAEAQNATAVTRAVRELEIEQQKLAILAETTGPNRVDRAKLELLGAEDRAAEDDEELKQLEMLYAKEEFADQTKEIVLERGRRRLTRSQRDLELRRQELAVLTDKTLPLETTEQQAKVESKEQGLEQVRREAEASRMDRRIAVLKAEAEVAKAEADLQALREKIDQRHAKAESAPTE